MKRLLASLLIAAVTLLSIEGVLGLAGQPLLVPRLWTPAEATSEELSRPLTDAERRRAGAENSGLFSAHPDPRVGFVLRPGSEFSILEGSIRSDALGLRARPGPPARDNALRIAVMGASIPFGFGVDDDETLAHRIEQALETARGPDARQVACRTVAITRWNVVNATAFLHDHMDVLRPDIVLFMPYDNDLSDTDVVGETGHRRSAPDATQPDPWLCVRKEDVTFQVQRLQNLAAEGRLEADLEQLGADALNADLSPESSRRYDQNAAALLRLRAELAARGARFVYLQLCENIHGFHMLERLLRAAPDLEVIPLLDSYTPEFSLGHDAHPSAETYSVLGAWVARELIDRGLVDRGSGELPAPGPANYEERRAQPRPARAIVALANKARADALAELQPVIDFTTGRGVRQVYGSIGSGGTAGPRLVVLLGRGGDALELELAPLATRPEQYPLDVTVQVDGAVLGVLRIEADGPARARFALPPGETPAIEVRLSAPDWVAGVFSDYELREIAAYTPLRIACDDG